MGNLSDDLEWGRDDGLVLGIEGDGSCDGAV